MPSDTEMDDELQQQILREAGPPRSSPNQSKGGLTLEDDLDALKLGGGGDLSDDESSAGRNLEVLVVIPRDQRKHQFEMESVPLKHVKEFFKGRIDPKNYTWGLQDESNNFRPSPVAYYDVEHPPGANEAEKGQRRRENWERIQESCGVKLRPFAKRADKALTRDDPDARYQTVNGEEHVRRWKYEHPEKSGEEMPSLRITKPSNSVPWGRRYFHYFSDNPKVAGKMPSELAEKYGAENVNVKTVEGGFPTVKTLNERGRFEADRAYANVRGLKYSYNKTLPKVAVQYKDSLISVDLINDQTKWPKQPLLEKLHNKLQKNPRSLTVAMLNEEETTYVTPSFVARLQPNHYAKVQAAHNLPKGVEKCEKQIEGGKNWIQTAENVLTTTDAAKQTLEAGQTLAQKYPDVQMFSPKLKDGKAVGSLKMIYATRRDQEEITQSVADDFGIQAQANRYEQQRDAAKAGAPTKDAALQAVYDEGGYDSDSSSNARNSMINSRANERAQQARST